ncbi:MAG: XTP/dITP diphosphatase [Chloroflexi bacterium]|nr:XTP/dITP diphosphatase [Chloroflexota bacterium]
MKLLIATGNPGKVREYAALLAGLNLTLVLPSDLGLLEKVEESGLSYAQNALRKAMAYARASGMWTLADDSGLEVDALNGAPGVHSARYAGPQASDQDRYRLLLRNLKGVPEERRTARFRCAIALASPTGEAHVREGTCEGRIATEPSGSGGFGYDPVFYLPEVGCTMAELPAETKNRISHRARAAMKIREVLTRLIERQDFSASPRHPKILSPDELARRRQDWRAEGLTFVLTNGVFDLLHVGHVRYLQAARRLGDVLVVGLNSDASAQAIKGPGHPIQPQDERAEILAALSCVDYVVIFDQPTAEQLVESLQPDVYVKGGDYAGWEEHVTGKGLPEGPIVKAYGGQVKILPYFPGRSTSDLIRRIQQGKGEL